MIKLMIMICIISAAQFNCSVRAEQYSEHLVYNN